MTLRWRDRRLASTKSATASGAAAMGKQWDAACSLNLLSHACHVCDMADAARSFPPG
jgi:hypothetical protein